MPTPKGVASMFEDMQKAQTVRVIHGFFLNRCSAVANLPESQRS